MKRLVMIAAAIALTGTAANATEGYIQHGVGVRSKALAGADIAHPTDATAAVANPAGISRVGNSLDVGVSFFSPRRSFTAGVPTAAPGMGAFPLAPGTVDSTAELFFIPHAAVSYDVGGGITLGLSLTGNGGMNTTYKPGAGPGVFGGGTAGVDLVQLFVQPTIAYEFADGWSIGVAPVLAAQIFSAGGIGAFGGFSSNPAALSNRGDDYSYGFGGRVGILGEVAPGLRIAAAAQSRIYMTEFDKYAGLFAEQGDFDIPMNVSVGAAWDVTDDVTLMGSWRWIDYSSINSIGNPFASPGPLGANNGAGFGWESINVFSIGAEWRASDSVTLRAGYSYNEQPIPQSEVLFNILAPGVMQHHLTAGASFQLTDSLTLDAAVMWAPTETVSGVNPTFPAQTIEIEMEQFEATIGISYKF